MKHFKRILTLIMSMILVLSMNIAVFANVPPSCNICGKDWWDNCITYCPQCGNESYCTECNYCNNCGYLNKITSNTSQNIEVKATVGSSFEVTIPKEITLSSTGTGSGTYEADIPVTVKGDIPTNQVITVDTSDSIVLTNTANTSATETVDATITKGETEFDFNALTGGQTATTSHGVSAELTPGSWTGTAQFNINLGEPVIEYTKSLWSWSSDEGTQEFSSGAIKLGNNYLNKAQLSDNIKIVYKDNNEGLVYEHIISTTNDKGGYISANFEGLWPQVVYDYTSSNNLFTGNGIYIMKGSYVNTMGSTIHASNVTSVEIYGPAE